MTSVTTVQALVTPASNHFFGALPAPSNLTLLSAIDSRLVSIPSVPLYFIASVGVNFTETSQVPAATPLDFGPRSLSSQSCVTVNGLFTPDSISIRIGSGTFFFFTLPAFVIFTDLIGLSPISTLPKFSFLGEILSLPTTGVGVAVGVGGGVAEAVTSTVNCLVSLDGLSEPPPGKLAASVISPSPDGVS